MSVYSNKKFIVIFIRKLVFLLLNEKKINVNSMCYTTDSILICHRNLNIYMTKLS